jgi:hypothetical protein
MRETAGAPRSSRLARVGCVPKESGVGKEIPMKYVVWAALVVAVGMVGWQILAAEITNTTFQDELREMSQQLSTRVGLTPPSSDEETREIVIRKPDKHGILLDPKQVTVRTAGPWGYRVRHVEVDYVVPVNLLVYSFNLHFAPASTGVTF